MDFILQWIDLVWLPLGLVVAHKGQRLIMAGYFLSCAFMLRLQIELLNSTGFAKGFLGFIEMDPFIRGQIVYSIFAVLFLILAVYSPKSEKMVFMAAAISIFFAALFTSMLLMVV